MDSRYLEEAMKLKEYYVGDPKDVNFSDLTNRINDYLFEDEIKNAIKYLANAIAILAKNK